MKIEIELPDWREDRHIRIFYGVELVAMLPQGKDEWRVKTERCDKCGLCCTIPPSNPRARKMINGLCEFARPDGDGFVCDIAFDRMQCFGDPIAMTKDGRCAIRHEYQKAKIE